MGFVEAKCTSCGAHLEVDNSKDAAICRYCNTPFIVEKAIQYYKNEVTISNSNVIINNYGNNEVESKIQAAKRMYEIGEIEEAENIYRKLKNTCPDDYRVWWGLFLCHPNYDGSYGNYKKAIALCDEAIKNKLRAEYLELRKGTFWDCSEFDEEQGSQKSRQLAEYFNDGLKAVCENEWKMALRHKYQYIIKTMLEEKEVEIICGKNIRDYFYAKENNQQVKFEKFKVIRIARNTVSIDCYDEYNEFHVLYLKLNTYVDKREDIDAIIEKLRTYPVINEEKPYDEYASEKFAQKADFVMGLLSSFFK